MAAITVAEQSVYPPRILISVTGLVADDIVQVSLYRQQGTALVPVRAATEVDVTGQDAFLRVDGEHSFGVPLTYMAELVDDVGARTQVTSGSITSTVSSDVISDAVRGVGAAVTIEAWPSKQRSRAATEHNVGGRIVVVSRPRSTARATVRVRTDTVAAGDALQEVLDGATEGVIQIRKQVTTPGVDNWLAVISDAEDRTWWDAIRWWELQAIEVEPWPDVLEAAGYTLADLADEYDTLADLADAFTPGTLLDIALADLGG